MTREFTAATAPILPAPSFADFAVFRIPAPPFALAPELRPRFARMEKRLLTVMTSLAGADPIGHLQFNQLHLGNAAGMISAHGAKWLPAICCGIFPHLPPPSTYTVEEFENMDPHDKARPVCHQLFELTGTDPAVPYELADILGGSGVPFWIFADRKRLAPVSEALRATVVEEIFRNFPAYRPLFSAATFEVTPPMLSEILAPISGFLRESPEDGGLLLGIRAPQDGVLAGLSARPPGKDGDAWSIDLAD